MRISDWSSDVCSSDLRAADAPTVDTPRWIDLRTAAASWPAFEATAFAQSRAVLHWQARHRHCGVCGTALEYRRAGWLGGCPRCELDHYPRPEQPLNDAITHGPRPLVGRAPGRGPPPHPTLAAPVSPGESAEPTPDH